MIEWIVALDKELLLFLNGHHTAFADAFMLMVSGKVIWSVFYCSILVSIFMKFKPKTSFIILLGVGVLVLLCDQIASGLFKPLFERLRPSHDPEIKNMVHIINNYTGGRFGFASSHASNCFGLAFFVSALFKDKIVSTFIIAWAILVAYSRIHLGVHFPGDIVMGGIIAFASAKLVYYIVDKFITKDSLVRKNKTSKGKYIVIIGIVQLIVMLFCSYYVVKGVM